MSNAEKLVHLDITFRNIDSTDSLKEYANEKLSSVLKKFVHQNTEAHLVLTVSKKRQIAEITFHTDGADFKNSEESEDMYKSIDSLADSLSNQLRRHKEKLTKHH